MDAFKVAVSIFECGRVGPGESDEDRECNYTAVSERTKETKMVLHLLSAFRTLPVTHNSNKSSTDCRFQIWITEDNNYKILWTSQTWLKQVRSRAIIWIYDYASFSHSWNFSNLTFDIQEQNVTSNTNLANLWTLRSLVEDNRPLIVARFYFPWWNFKRSRILKSAKWLRPCSSCTKGLNRLLIGQAAVGWTATHSSSTPAHLFTQVCDLLSRFFSLSFSHLSSSPSFFSLLVSSLPLLLSLFCSSSQQTNDGGLPLSCWSWIHQEPVHSRSVNFCWYKSPCNFLLRNYPLLSLSLSLSLFHSLFMQACIYFSCCNL